MNKLSAVLFLMAGLSISAFAADRVPVDSKGEVTNPLYAGASTCEVTSATSTRAALCATGSGIILDVFASSVAATDAIVLRDSATANTTSTRLLTLDLTDLGKKPHVWPRFKNGLSVNALTAATPAGAASNPSWTIVYQSF